jgi:hypothetical protein
MTVDARPPSVPALVSPADGAAVGVARPTFDWEAAVDQGPSGVAGYNLQVEAEVYTVTAPTTVFTLPSDIANNTLLHWSVRAYDGAGNYGEFATERTVLIDLVAPHTVAITAPEHISATQFLIAWSALDDESGVASYTIEYSGTLFSSWQAWLVGTEETSGMFAVPQAETDYIFRVTAIDRAGNPAWAMAETWVGAYRVYLPFVLRAYRPFNNGTFDGGLTGWSSGRGPFSGHGGGLDSGTVVLGGNRRALLGDPAAANGAIRVGYGYIAQTFSVDRPHLQIQYRVVSYDIVYGKDGYYDTFEVSLNRAPSQITNAQRNSRGCADTVLNPTGTLVVPGDGLAFCAGRSGSSSDTGTEWDSGWRTVTLDLSAFQGESVTLYLSQWSREYKSPYYNDQGWYNTWAYVDNLILQE